MKCNLCNSSLIDNDTFLICPSCGLIVKKGHPFELEEKERYLAHQYDENYKSYMHGLTNFIDFNNKEVLDFGCGQHPILNELYPEAKFTNYDYYFFPKEDYKNLSYDIILLIEVIEHISNIKATIENLLALLKCAGKIYIHTRLYDEATDFKTWWYQRDITHISFFNIKTFEYLASKYNLNLEQINEFIVLKRS